MRYSRKITTKDILTKISNFNQKALPDPNTRYTTMDKFVKSNNIKSRFMQLGNNASNFLNIFSIKKNKILCKPIIYSKNTGYKNSDTSHNIQKKDNLVIPLLDEDN